MEVVTYSHARNDLKSLLDSGINRLIKDAAREPFAGIGKPEPLRGNLAGYWSRRIDDSHRLVYRATDTELVVIACRFHYDG
jgi:toxin YoeB